MLHPPCIYVIIQPTRMIIFRIRWSIDNQGEKIMKKIVLTSIGALMMSVVAAGAAESNQSNYKVFFGINAGIHGWNYASQVTTILGSLLPTATTSMFGSPDNAIKIENPKNETMVGMEGGVRFGKHSAVWNGGFTIAADKTMGKKPNITAPEKFWNDPASLGGGSIPGEAWVVISALAKDFKFHTNIISASFDNYIRLNKSRENRLDLVAGVGIADIETNMNLWGVGMSFASHAAMLKAGLELELTENISVTLGSRMYIPVSSQFYASQYDLKGGFKFLF